MTSLLSCPIASRRLLAIFTAILLLSGSDALAQCPSTELVSGLRMPLAGPQREAARRDVHGYHPVASGAFDVYLELLARAYGL